MGAEDLKNELHNSDVPITHRSAVTRKLDAEWLDRLLIASSELKPDAALEDAVAAILGAAAEALPDAAIGACVPSGGDGQIVVRRAGRDTDPGSPDPSRLFPQYAFERVVAVQFDESSTLHLASDDEERFAEDGAFHGLLDRVSLALGAAIRRCRAFERARTQSVEVRGLQAQVIQSEKLASLGQIAAGIVHELNNPLTSIVAYSDFLKKKAERAGGDAGDVERLMRINEAAERILRFSRDLTAYSRPSAEVPAPVVVRDVIDRALVFCEHVIEETGVAVERRFEEERPVRGVGGQLTQVFVNLFTNACHAMRGRGGRLVIATEMSQMADTVLVTITDDGHGIDTENLTRVFEPFFTTKTDGSGTGLGLSIVRNIIASHGGEIRAERHLPRGTVFHIELPIAATPSSMP